MCIHRVKRILLMVCCTIVLLIYSTFAMSIVSSDVTSAQSNVKTEIDMKQISSKQVSWINKMQMLRSDVKDCVKQLNQTTWNCFKKYSLHLFDDIMSAEVIPIYHGVRFVRCKNAEGIYVANKGLTDAEKRKNVYYLTWFDQLANRLTETLKTHVLEINLKEMADAYLESMDKMDNQTKLQNADPNGTGRHRRQRYNMIITMMFGVTALGAVLVPMGFQILSVVSGKALLLAKMALLLASINGLKRVANSGVHYGLYQVPGEHYGAGYYDRGDVHHPRNVPALTVAQPLEMGL